jgi:hypothetical protein
VRERYDWSHVVAATESTYADVLAGRPARAEVAR